MTAQDRKYRILLVDDDLDVLELLEYNLIKHGYGVKCVDDALLAIDEACNYNPDLIVLDVVMPNQSGFETCRRLREIQPFYTIPLFFLTAKSDSSVLRTALTNGGDDLIHKNVGLKSLMMKIDSVLKDGLKINKRVENLIVGDLLLNRESQTVNAGKRQIQLSDTEFEFLFLLAQNPNLKISAPEIANHLWGQAAAGIGDLVNRLCEKLGTKWIIEDRENHYRLNPHLK